MMNERLAARQTASHDGDDNHDHHDIDDHVGLDDHDDHDYYDYNGDDHDHHDLNHRDHHEHNEVGAYDDDNGDNHCSGALLQAVLPMHGLQSLRSEEILMNSDLSKAAAALWR